MNSIRVGVLVVMISMAEAGLIGQNGHGATSTQNFVSVVRHGDEPGQHGFQYSISHGGAHLGGIGGIGSGIATQGFVGGAAGQGIGGGLIAHGIAGGIEGAPAAIGNTLGSHGDIAAYAGAAGLGGADITGYAGGAGLGGEGIGAYTGAAGIDGTNIAAYTGNAAFGGANFGGYAGGAAIGGVQSGAIIGSGVGTHVIGGQLGGIHSVPYLAAAPAKTYGAHNY